MGRAISSLEKYLRRHLPPFWGGVVLAAVLPAGTFAVSFLAIWLLSRWSVWAGFALETFWCWQCLAVRGMLRESRNVYEKLAIVRQMEETGASRSTEAGIGLREEGGKGFRSVQNNGNREGAVRGSEPFEAALRAAREAVGRIVGRDTANLDAAGVARAAVETVAENFSDGVYAPLFYMCLGGAPLALAYKAVNTMDSMVGYKNERYILFGRAAARLDDAANFLPARISALLLILATCMCRVLPAMTNGILRFAQNDRKHTLCNIDIQGGNRTDGIIDRTSSKNAFWVGPKNAFRIWRRDRRKHASPNSAQCEAVMAGALGIRLGGPTPYFGKMHEKPWLGDDLRPIEAEDILRANRLFLVAAFLGLGISVLALILISNIVIA